LIAKKINFLTELSKIIIIQTASKGIGWSEIPNPFLEMITINSIGLKDDVSGLNQIVNIARKVVFEDGYLFQREENLELKLGHLSPGVYLLLISNLFIARNNILIVEGPIIKFYISITCFFEYYLEFTNGNSVRKIGSNGSRSFFKINNNQTTTF